MKYGTIFFKEMDANPTLFSGGRGQKIYVIYRKSIVADKVYVPFYYTTQVSCEYI